MPWGKMSIELFGGLALFLFGMEMMAASLKNIAGEKMRKVLGKLTKTPLTGAATGAAVTAIIQSSSVTTVLVVGFITANLMSVGQSIGIIMGANIGTTITAQIIAFKVTKLALPILTVGFAIQFFSKNEKTQSYGQVIMGLGLIFFGMSVMSTGMYPLRESADFMEALKHLDNPLIAILYAAAFTALVQSSSATTGIVIVMSSAGFLSLETGIALIFGANIGTCITALLAAIGKPREALRAAVVHVLFNVLGVVVWIAFIGHLAEFVTWFSPTAPEFSGTDKLAAEVPRQLANAHTVFNVANTLIFLPFTGYFAMIVQRLVPIEHKTIDRGPDIKPRYLSPILLETPSMAFEAVQREIRRMGNRVSYMLKNIIPAIISNNYETLMKIKRMDDEVDALHNAIIYYLGEMSKENLNQGQTRELVGKMEAVNALENIGDVIETNLAHLGESKIEQEIVFSQATEEVINEIFHQVEVSLSDALKALNHQDVNLANSILRYKKDIKHMVREAYKHQAARLVAEQPDRLATYRLEIDIIERLKHIYDCTKRIARTVITNKKKSSHLTD